MPGVEARSGEGRVLGWLLSLAQQGTSSPSVLATGALAIAALLTLVLAPLALWLALSDS